MTPKQESYKKWYNAHYPEYRERNLERIEREAERQAPRLEVVWREC